MSEQAYLLELRWITEQICTVSFLALKICDNFTEFLLSSTQEENIPTFGRGPQSYYLFFSYH